MPAYRLTATLASWWQRMRFTRQLVQARLRFVVLVAVVFAFIASWPRLEAQWDRAVGWMRGRSGWVDTVSPDTEYFCPMCPGVLSGWPEKCPVCKMPLVRRKKGEAGLLPEGVVARMQLSPYRVQLAGIKTASAAYLPLERRVRLMGRSSGGKVVANVLSPDLPLVAAGRRVSLNRSSGETLAGVVDDVELQSEGNGRRATITPEQLDGLAEDEIVEIVVYVALSELEPWKSQPRLPPAIESNDIRTIFQCPDHPYYVHTKRGKCWFDDNDLEDHPLAADERLEWRCVLHPTQISRQSGQRCAKCEQALQPVITTYLPEGRVLAVPESALVQTSGLQVVYVESMPGMFDGRVVSAGPVCDGFVPILDGIKSGDKVVATSAFLLDAETRLNPHLAAAYFGAGNILASAGAEGKRETRLLEADRYEEFGLSPFDLAMVRRQKICPVTNFALDSMGGPVRVDVDSQPIYLCCEGCRGRVRGAPPRKPKTAEPAR